MAYAGPPGPRPAPPLTTRQQGDRYRRRLQNLRSTNQTPHTAYNDNDDYHDYMTPSSAQQYHPNPDGPGLAEDYADSAGGTGRGNYHYGYPPFHYDHENYGRTPLDSLPAEMRLHADATNWGCGTEAWYGHAHNSRRYMDHQYPRHFGLDDHEAYLQAHRARWRDDMLNGDVDKGTEGGIPPSTLAFSFITRGSPTHPHGQGDELLFFRPRRKDPTRAQLQCDMRTWAFLCVEASPIVPIGSTDPPPTAEQLSHQSIAKVLPHIDIAKDLRLIRRSKPLRWDEMTLLETFLYRLAESKEDTESDAYKELEQKLGPGLHYWTQLNGFHGAIESEVVATAIISICLPMAVSAGIDHIFADTTSRNEQLATAALDVLYLCVQAGYARDAFRYYPIPAPVVGKAELEGIVKRRMWAYWTEVVCWHLCRVRPAAQVSITYSITKALSAIRDAIDDPKLKIDDVEKLLVNSIAFEADRARNAGRQLIREGVAEILYNPAFSLDKPTADPALESLQVFTHSSASAVYGVLAKLITHVLSRKGSPGPGSSVNRKIWDLKITIAESRPLNEGVGLAVGLGEVINSYAKYKEKTAEINRQTSEPPGVQDLGPSAIDNAIQTKLRNFLAGSLFSPLKNLKDGTSNLSPGRANQALGLAELLAELDSKKEVREPKVTIQVSTDAALPSLVMAAGKAGQHPIVLIGADHVLSNGDVVNKAGTAAVAWAGKTCGGSVLCLVRSDRIHPSNVAAPPLPSNAGTELVPAWKYIASHDQLEAFTTSPYCVISNPLFDETSHENISGYITDMGFMGLELLTEFIKIQAETVTAVGLD